MKKSKKTAGQKQSALRRAKKRSDRSKKTQSEKHVKKMAIILKQKEAIEKQNEEINKILQSRIQTIS